MRVRGPHRGFLDTGVRRVMVEGWRGRGKSAKMGGGVWQPLVFGVEMGVGCERRCEVGGGKVAKSRWPSGARVRWPSSSDWIGKSVIGGAGVHVSSFRSA